MRLKPSLVALETPFSLPSTRFEAHPRNDPATIPRPGGSYLTVTDFARFLG